MADSLAVPATTPRSSEGCSMKGVVEKEAEKKGLQQQQQRCQSWLQSKRRLCASPAMPGSQYCGNHKPSAAQTRVCCPMDPSHTILQEEVAIHSRKCPAVKQLERFEKQTYFAKGINAGETIKEFGASESVQSQNKFLSPGLKRAAVSAMSTADFQDLLRRIEKAFEQSCREVIEISILQPQACSKWLSPDRDRKLPYQEKHALQQASLLGNLESFGLVNTKNGETADDRNGSANTGNKSNFAVVELGAGRGYLSHMLCDCYNVQNVVMVERRSYKFKADRTLRQLQGIALERLRIDIEDLNLQEVQSLQGCNFIAVSKHLCGPATDLSLRCCIHGADSGLSNGTPNNEGCREGPGNPMLDGLGIATCCHHLCQWSSYINKQFFHNLGFSIQDFHAITWLTSWALSGTEEHGLTESGALMEASDLPVDHAHAVPHVSSKPRLSEAMNAIDATARAVLGRKCKRLIDMGRLQWLTERGMQAKLVEYIAASVSPENRLLLARWANVTQ
ncbi:unnamed protein product [Sphagnum jensenii]|uniref:tRNA:m(4)X modification enzyme TRM13 n=1 Tax=Sphagnum jensenii TaxID=128206 RepID=A0ABP1B3H5_9BRYO